MMDYIRNGLAGLALTAVVACSPVPGYVNETVEPLVKEAEAIVEDYNQDRELFSKDKRITRINQRIDRVLLALDCDPGCLDLAVTQFGGVADDYELKEIERDDCSCDDYGTLVNALKEIDPEDAADISAALQGKSIY